MRRIGPESWLVEEVARQCRLPETVVRRVLNTFVEKVKEATWKLGRLRVPGFLTLSVRRVGPRTVVSPGGSVTELEERSVVKAKPTSDWRVRR